MLNDALLNLVRSTLWFSKEFLITLFEPVTAPILFPLVGFVLRLFTFVAWCGLLEKALNKDMVRAQLLMPARLTAEHSSVTRVPFSATLYAFLASY